MKTIRYLILAGISLASLCGPRVVLSQTVTPPVVVVPHDDQDLHRDLRGAPDNIKNLIISFDQTRDKYLVEQAVLLAKFKNATTPEEREKIREQLQDNRALFLSDLQAFRTQLKDDLALLKDKISHEEFKRIIDAAHDAVTEGGVNHHKAH